MTKNQLRDEEDMALNELDAAFNARQAAFLLIHSHLINYPKIAIDNDILDVFELADKRYFIAESNIQKIAKEIREGKR